MGIYNLKVKIDPFNLPPDLKEKAARELNEDINTRQDMINNLRKLIKEDDIIHLRTDDEFLLRFLRTEKFRLHRAFKRMKNYYVVRERHRDLFVQKHPREVDEIMKENYSIVLTDSDVDGCVIFCTNPGIWDTSRFSLTDFVKMCLLWAEYVQIYPISQINGARIYFNFRGFGARHALCITPTLASRTVHIIQGCLPIRVKGFHCLNISPFFYPACKVMSFFLTKKMRQRIILHGSDLQSLYDLTPMEQLPDEFCGSAGPLDVNEFWKILTNDKNLIYELNNFFGQTKC